MPAYAFEGIVPVVDPSAYVHPTASVIGDALVGPRSYIGPGASLRGDFGRIIIEGDTSVQDNCTLHASDKSDCLIGRGATIGHGAIAHGCKIGVNTLIGMNAVVLDDAEIGDECLVAARSLIKPDMALPPRSYVAGNPGKFIRALSDSEIRWRNDGDGAYQRLADRALKALVECTPLPAAEANRPRNRGGERPVRLKTIAGKEA